MPKRKTIQGTVPVLLESERAALGAALKNHESAEIVTQELTEDCFFGEANRRIFAGIKELIDSGLEVSTVSIADRVPESRLELDELSQCYVSGNVLNSVIKDLLRTRQLRTVLEACKEAESGIANDAKLEDVLGALESSLYRLDGSGTNEAKDGSVTLQNVINSFLERHRTGGGPEVSTGLKELDRAIIGLRPGKLMVIAGRPSMGKTALADTIRRAVVAQGYGAITFSLEMSADELLERELAYQAQINLRKVMAAKEVSEDELKRVIGAGASILPGRWVIDDSSYTIGAIKRRARIMARRMARDGIKLGAIVLDYIQLAGDTGDDRQQSISAISRGCKLLAKELGCTVLALSQLNRMCELRDDRRPMLSDLRESGAIEQDADIVGFVFRECMYNSSIPADESEFIIRKQRSGPTGSIHLKYNHRVCAFSDKQDNVVNSYVPDAVIC